MNDDRSNEVTLSFDISDEALEAAAGTTMDAASTLPGGVSVNIMCCGGDYITAVQRD